MSESDYDDDELIFASEGDSDEDSEEITGYWNVLIVDDDEEIHSVTKLALSDLVVANRKLNFLHAYSGKEVLEKLQVHNDIAIILLDVVMETDDAGLNTAKAIREELCMDEPRIILRTGQPGYAPEESVIKEYDINDYKTKTELTRSKLVTTIISSIRSYQQIKAINQSRKGLEGIISSSTHVFEEHSIDGFSDAVVTACANILGFSADGFVCSTMNTFYDDEMCASQVSITGATGCFEICKNKQIDSIQNKTILSLVEQCFSDKQSIIDDQHIALYLSSHSCEGVVYFEFAEPLESVQKQLIEVFSANISVGFENVYLFRQLSHAAYKDRLTLLNNRTEFINCLDEYRRKNANGGAVAIVDLDHFSDFNDGLGQDVGDALLQAVTARLQEHYDSDVVLARVGADVFGLLGGVDKVNVETIQKVFEQPFKANEHTLPLTITMGLCQSEDFSTTGKDILKQAYIALNAAKKNLVENCEYYVPEMAEQTAWRLAMIRQLKADFAERKLQVWYQPQKDLMTGKFIGMEALLRWPSEDGGFISPAVFVPLAEYSGLIIDIGRFVLLKSCECLRNLHDSGYADFRVAVNVSMPQFRDPYFVDMVIKTVQDYSLPPECLELEITESVVMDDPKIVIEALNKLKAFGVSIAIDDFGTGFSSLSYLQKLPLDRIKVDRDFIKDINKENAEQEGVIAETVINLGKRFGLSTIAEGVETEEQVDYVRSLGCDEVQGFLYAKPMPTSDLVDFLK